MDSATKLPQNEIFKKVKTRRYVQYVSVAIGLILLVLVLSMKDLQICVLPLFLVLYGFTVAVWRCPNCNAFLGRGRNPKTCPRCGVPLSPNYTPEFEKLLLDLQSDSSSKRYDACEELRVIPQIPTDAIRALESATKHPDSSTAEAAARALAAHSASMT